MPALFKEILVLATGSLIRRLLVLLVCLTTARAWADDLSFAASADDQSSPAPPVRQSPSTTKPSSSTKPNATRPRSASTGTKVASNGAKTASTPKAAAAQAKTGPSAKPTPTANQVAYQSRMAYPVSQAPPAAREEVSTPRQPTRAVAADPNSDVSPDEMFPSMPDGYDSGDSMAPTLPAYGCFQGQCGDPDDQEDRAPPAGMTLNSGNWFSRGCWYAQEDAVFLMRSERGRFKRILTVEFDPTVVTSSPTTGAPGTAVVNAGGSPVSLGEIIYIGTGANYVSSPLQFSLPLISAQNQLLISPSLGFSPGARLTVGYRLGTDAMNRQSSIEFTFQGLNNWSIQNSITASQPFENTLFTGFSPPPPVTSFTPAGGPSGTEAAAPAAPLTSYLTNNAPGFTFANFMQYTYNANFNSYELNFKVAKRLGRDRTVLTREGIWARVVTPQFLPALYGGLRLIRYNEQFLWRSEGVNPAMIAGNYDVQTQNSAIGPQFGGNLTYHHENWKVTARMGGGALVNFANQRSIINGYDVYSAAAINRSDTNNNAALSMLLDFGVNSTYYFRPNMGWRFGYQLIAVSNLALAERQLNFQALNPPIMNQNHGLYFQGVSTGFDFSW